MAFRPTPTRPCARPGLSASLSPFPSATAGARVCAYRQAFLVLSLRCAALRFGVFHL